MTDSRPGTGTIGTWSIVSSTGNCGPGSFSDINDADATFTAEAGTYVLRWTVGNCIDEVEVTITNCDVVDFDGENDHITFKDNYHLNGDFSLEVWVKPNTQFSGATSNIQTILSKRNGYNSATGTFVPNGAGYDLRLDQNDYISFNWNNGSSMVASNPISTNRWYHIAVTYDGS